MSFKHDSELKTADGEKEKVQVEEGFAACAFMVLSTSGYFSNNVEYDGRNLLLVNNSYHINSNLCIALLNTCL